MAQRIVINGKIQEAVREPLKEIYPKLIEIAQIIKKSDIDMADSIRFMETILMSELGKILPTD